MGEYTFEDVKKAAMQWYNLTPRERLIREIEAIGKTGTATALFVPDQDKAPGWFKLFKSNPVLPEFRDKHLRHKDVLYFSAKGWKVTVYNADGKLTGLNPQTTHRYGFGIETFKGINQK